MARDAFVGLSPDTEEELPSTQGDSFFKEPDKQSGPSGQTPMSQPDFGQPNLAQTIKRSSSPLNRIRAEDLSARGIPSYRNASGDVSAVRDEDGAPLTGLNAKTGIAYDAKGEPKQVSYDETGGPKLSDPFEKLPKVTDPKTGAIEQYGPGGLYKYIGQDPQVTAKAQQAAGDKEMGQEAALMGRKLTLDEHDMVAGNKEQKALHSQLTDPVSGIPELADPKYKGASADVIKKAIDDHFNTQYGAPEANATTGFFGSGELTPDAKALRAGLDQKKASAHDAVDRIFDLNDQLSQLDTNIKSGRQTERDQVETMLAHKQGQPGPLDVQQARSNTDLQTGLPQKSTQLYPPEQDWSRMLGGDDAVKQIQDNVRSGKFPSVAAPAATAAVQDAQDAQKKADELAKSDPSTADKYKNFATSILNGLTQGLGELARNPMMNKGEMPGGNLNPLNWGPHLVEAGERKAFGKAFSDLTDQWIGHDLPDATSKLVDQRLKDTIGTKAGNFVGGILPYVGAAIATKGTSVATPLLTSMFYASGYQSTLEDAQRHGASPVKAEGAAVVNGAINAVLALPLKTVGAAAEAIFGDTAPKLITRAIKSAYDSAGAKGLQDILTQLKGAIQSGEKPILGGVAQDLRQQTIDGVNAIIKELGKTAGQRALTVAQTAGAHAALGAGVQTAENLTKKTYNPDQGTFEGVPESAIGFGVLGGLSEGFKQVADARKAKQALDIINSGGSGGEGPKLGGPNEPPAPGKGPGPGGTTPVAPRVEKPVKGRVVTPEESPSKPGQPPSKGAPQLTEGGETPNEKPQGGISPTTKPGTPAGEPARPEVPQPQSDNANAPAKGGAAAGAGAEGAQERPGPGRQPVLTSIKDAEKAFVEQGGHADKLEGQQKLEELRKKYPAPGDRLDAINKHFESPAPATVDEAAHEAATSPKNGLPEPSQAQKDAGNYQKGHEQIGPTGAKIDVSIENPAGSMRRPEWPPLQSHYGYVKGTVGADKDHVDVFVKQGTPKDWSGPVFVVNQHNEAGKFDEHKAVIGVHTPEDAKAEYTSNYQQGWNGGRSVVKFKNTADFKQWAESGVGKGKPAPDPRLPSGLGKVAVAKGVSFNRETASGALMFSDTSNPRATSFQISKPDIQEFLKKLTDVRKRMEGSPEQKKAAAELEKKKAEREAAKKAAEKPAEKPVAAPEKKPETKPSEKPVEKPAEKPESGPPTPAPKPETGGSGSGGLAGEGDTVPHPAKRPWTEDRVRETLAKSPAMRGAFARGLTLHEDPKLGGGGMAVRTDSNVFLVDVPAVVDHEAHIDRDGGDGELHLEWSVIEELIHVDTIRALGRDFAKELKAIYAAQPAIEPLTLWWRSNAPWTMSAEWIRMLVQMRTIGHITEDSFGKDQGAGYTRAELHRLLAQPQPPIVERAVAKVMNLAPDIGLSQGENPPPIAEPEPEPESEKAPNGAIPAPLIDEELGKALDQTFEGLFNNFLRATEFKPAPYSPGDMEAQAKWLEKQASKRGVTATALAEKQPDIFAKLAAGWRKTHPLTYFPTLLRSTGAADQHAIPPDKMGAFLQLAQTLAAKGIDTPDKLAAVLEAQFAGKARPYSQGLWDAIGMIRPELRGTHDWKALYAAIDQKKEKVLSPAEVVTKAVKNRLTTGPMSRTELTKLVEANGLSAKEGDEAAEIGITHRAREIAAGPGTEAEKFAQMVELYDRQPNLSAKTSTSKVNQAYSTPAPLAFAASRLADIAGGKSVYEPAAGNGMLLIEADPAKQKVLANEIDPARQVALQKTFPLTSFSDATEPVPVSVDRVIANPPFGRVLTEDQTTKEWPLAGTGETTHEIDHAIAMQALATLKDNSVTIALSGLNKVIPGTGRAVLILGGKNPILKGFERAQAYLNGDGAKFWKALYEKYRVIDHFTLAGDLYKKQGAGWPVDVVVIAGHGQSPIQLPNAEAPRILTTWNELGNEIARSDADRIAAGKYDVEKDRKKVGGIFDDIKGISAGPDGEPAGRGDSGSAGPTRQPGAAGGETTSTGGGEPALHPEGPTPRSDEITGGGAGAVGPGTGEQLPLIQPGVVDPDSFRVPYIPQSVGGIHDLQSFKVFIPTHLEAPVRKALEKLKAKVGPLDEYVRKSLGYAPDAPLAKYFSAEQADSLAQAIFAAEELGLGAINGDQGGIGKGRVGAGMMAYVLKQGWIPIFVTQDEKLYAEMIKDLHNIGRSDIVPMFTNTNINFEDEKGGTWSQSDADPLMEKILADGKLPVGIKALFTSYNQIGSSEPKGWKNTPEGRAYKEGMNIPKPPGLRLLALQKLAPKGFIIADESHLASGESLAGERLHALMGNAKGRYYLSATWAKRADSMGIYNFTSLSYATTDMQELIAAMKQGGNPMLQVVTNILAADGLYGRRERDFSGVTFKAHVNVDTAERDVKLADNYTAGLREIMDISSSMKKNVRKLNELMARYGQRYSVKFQPRLESVNFAAIIHNMIKQYLFAIKAEALVQRAIDGIKATPEKGFKNVKGEVLPHKAVITFENTMEAPIEGLRGSKHPLNFNGLLLNSLDKQRVLTVKCPRGCKPPKGAAPAARGRDEVTTITDTPDPEFEHLSNDQLAAILVVDVHTNESGQKVSGLNEKAAAELFRRLMSEAFQKAEEKIKALDLADMPLSPIDYMKRRLAAEGIGVVEMTGRSIGIDEDGAIYDIPASAHSKKTHIRGIRAFNNDKAIQVMLMNAAGSFGISLHASKEFLDQTPRAMLTGQPNLDINKQMQLYYRTDRTGQVHQPYYEVVMSALSAELRPNAILTKKMGALNANTTSNAESEIGQGTKGVDIFNQYGDEVVHTYLQGDKDFVTMLDMPKILDGKGFLMPLDVIRVIYPENGKFAQAVTGRVGVMPEYDAKAFWENVTSAYLALIAYLDETGENDLKTDTVDMKAETLASRELTPVKAQTPVSGFQAASHLERIKAHIGLQPLSAKEVVALMGKLNAWDTEQKWKEVASEWKKKELARQIEKALIWNEKKQKALEDRWRAAENTIRNSINMIGSGLHIKTRRGVDGYGAVTAVHLDLENPLVPSKQMFELHVNTTKRHVRIPASQLADDARHSATDFEKVYEATADRSNERYMITGNLLAAFMAIKDSAPTAKIVNYTTAQGELHQGILMPVKFDPGQLEAKRQVDDADHLKQLLDAGRSVSGLGDAISIVKAPYGAGYVLRIPASKIMGGAYWGDPTLQKLMSESQGQFIVRGQAMIGKFTDVPKVYKRLGALGVQLYYREQAQQLHAAKYNPLKAAYDEDVAPVAKSIGVGAKEALLILRKMVAPRAGVRAEGTDAVMRMLGKQYEKAYQTDKVLEAWNEGLRKMERPDQIAFVDRMKRGEEQPTPELQQLADTMRKIDTDSWESANAAWKDWFAALGRKYDDQNPPLAWKEDHFRVLWKTIPGSDDAEKAAWIGRARRPLRGSMGQHKQSTLDDMSEGIALGGVPYTYNPVEMFERAQADLWKTTTVLHLLAFMKRNAFMEFVKGAFAKAPDGAVSVDDAAFKKYFPAESGEGLINAGQYFVEEGMARLLNNYLSRDLVREVGIGRGLIWLKNATTALELSLSPFHAIFETLETVGSNIGLGLQKLINRGLLGGNLKVMMEGVGDMIKAFGTPITHANLGSQFRRALIDPSAFFKTQEGVEMLKKFPNAREAAGALFEAGFKPPELEQDWRNNSIKTFLDALADIKAGESDNYIGMGLRAFPAANEMLMKPLFDHYIPNLKVAQFLKEFSEALEEDNQRYGVQGYYIDRSGKKWYRPYTRAQLARKIWDFVEDRFGEMNYDKIFWNRTFKSGMQLMFRSVTWKGGSVRAFGGAFIGQGKEFVDAFKEGRAPELHRNMAWLFGICLLTAALGTIISLTLAGKKPQNLTDMVFPQIDPKDDKIRVSLPTYLKDLVHLWHAPTSYVTSSLSGWIGRVADLWRNRDYYGTQIHDNDDPAVKQALDVTKYLAQTLLPFSIRGYKNLGANDVGALRKSLSLMGMQPAPRYISETKAQQQATEYWQSQSSEEGVKPGAMERRLEKRALVSQIEHGHAPNISQALAKGTIKPVDIKAIYQRASIGALASSVLHMPLADAEKVYRQANLKERSSLEAIMAQKRANSAKQGRAAFKGF